MPTPKKSKSKAITKAPQLILGLDNVKKASEISTALRDIIEKQKLYAIIPTRQGEKKFVTVEGWNTLGAMLGVFPEVVKTKDLSGTHEVQLPSGKTVQAKEIKYWAEVQLRGVNGKVISMAQGICSSNEKNWQGRDEYAIFSMAQTRATGKAFRLAFSWIVKMAGFEPTPSEEYEGRVKPKASFSEPTLPKVK